MARKTNLFIDTSGWGYLIDRHDPTHRSVVVVYQRAIVQKRKIVTTNYIITELVALLESRHHTPRRQIFTFIDQLKQDPLVDIVHITRTIDDEAWDLLKKRADKSWSLVDGASFVVMRRLGLTEALTTDHHFTQAGFARLPEPS
mgnify:CR=1 FL=1